MIFDFILPNKNIVMYSVDFTEHIQTFKDNCRNILAAALMLVVLPAPTLPTKMNV